MKNAVLHLKRRLFIVYTKYTQRAVGLRLFANVNWKPPWVVFLKRRGPFKKVRLTGKQLSCSLGGSEGAAGPFGAFGENLANIIAVLIATSSLHVPFSTSTSTRFPLSPGGDCTRYPALQIEEVWLKSCNKKTVVMGIARSLLLGSVNKTVKATYIYVERFIYRNLRF